ncbi:MAG: tRNA (adenosine(37)-N6)-threonylcarbamoyltransferase complex ATPase subunit type 1 TsaE [Desulfovibrionales bacterium]|nr:tRNA (adenosine(37)-N6)-threonylcarbamoyltransferase complex ATPase subunit type 1 TsaE [Desulfovibrionales bacterium]
MLVQAVSLETTITLAQCFARCMASGEPVPILMYGQLGVGKTTFVRHLVQALPGSDQAEVSSPSFNILNLYPTQPPVGHFDLYRTSGAGIDADIEEALIDSQLFCVVEWAEYLPQESFPDEYITMTWTFKNQGRLVDCAAVGAKAVVFLTCVQADFTQL